MPLWCNGISLYKQVLVFFKNPLQWEKTFFMAQCVTPKDNPHTPNISREKRLHKICNKLEPTTFKPTYHEKKKVHLQEYFNPFQRSNSSFCKCSSSTSCDKFPDIYGQTINQYNLSIRRWPINKPCYICGQSRPLWRRTHLKFQRKEQKSLYKNSDMIRYPLCSLKNSLSHLSRGIQNEKTL